MNNPKISVIVPVYKAESCLHRCVDSILAQTFSDFEVLLIDDGSPDKSGEICDEYALKDSRVRVFHKENGGVSSARNLGLDNAKGEWITFCDSDDMFEKDSLFEYLKAAKISGAQIIRGGYRTIYSNNEIRLCQINESKLIVSKDEMLLFMESSRYYGFLWNSLYHKSIIENIRFENIITWCEDHLFSLIAYNNCKSIYYIPDIVYNYVKQDSNSLSYPSNPYMIIDVANLEFEAKKKLINSEKSENETILLYNNKVGKAIKIAINMMGNSELSKFISGTSSKIKIKENKQNSKVIGFFYNPLIPTRFKSLLLRAFYRIL